MPHLKRLFLALWLLGAIALLPVLAGEGSFPIGSVTITDANCDYVIVRYTLNPVAGEEPPAPAQLTVLNGSASVGGTTGESSPGTYTETMTISAFPVLDPGAPLSVRVSYAGASVTSSSQPCTGYGGPPSEEPGDSSSPGDVPAAPPWSGGNDGRLNPDPAEYYTIYCSFDEIRVYRSTPDTALLKQIELSAATALATGGSLNVGDGMSLVRNSPDVMTVYGSNGNGAPDPGSKAFNVSACIDANGGEPSTETTAADTRSGGSGSEASGGTTTTSAAPDRSESESSRTTLDTMYATAFSSGGFGGLLSCLYGVGAPLAVFSSPAGLLLILRRGRRRRR